jgi:hypothetical protein
MPSSYGPSRLKTREAQRSFERQVLEYLKLYGPQDWNKLYALFDESRSLAIIPVLRDLKVGGYIVIDAEAQTSITDSGLKRLRDAQ